MQMFELAHASCRRRRYASVVIAASLSAIGLGWGSIAAAISPVWTQRSVPAAAKSMTVDGIACSGATCVAVQTVCGVAGCGGIPPSGILHSANRGVTWASAAVPDGVSPTNPNGIGGLDLVTCYSAVGCVLAFEKGPMGPASTGGFLYSTNGGSSWLQAVVPSASGSVTALTCETGGRCLAILETAGANPSLLASTDGGQTWRHGAHLPSAMGHFNGLWCWGTHCVAVGTNSHGSALTAASVNYGSTWSTSRPPTIVSAVYDVACPTAKKCYAVGYGRTISYGKILVSTTGGTSWKLSSVPAGTGIQLAVACLGESTCISVGGQSSVNPARPDALLTTNGGGRWSRQTLPLSLGQLNAIACLSGGRCIATGEWLKYTGKNIVASGALILSYH